MNEPHFTLSDNYAPGIPYQKQEENTHLAKPHFMAPHQAKTQDLGKIDLT